MLQSSFFPRKRAFLAGRKEVLPVEPAEDLDELRNRSGPAGLVACAQARTAVPVEILVEENIVFPVGIGLKFLRTAVNRTLPGLVPQEYPRQPVGNFASHLEQVHPGAGTRGTLDLEVIPVIEVVRHQG